MRNLRFALPLAAVLGAAPAAAQTSDFVGPRAGSWEMTLSGAGQSDNEFDNNSLGLGFGIGYYLTDNITLGLRQNLNWSDTPRDSSLNGTTRGALDYVFGTGRLRPFVGATLGISYGEDIDDTGIIGPEVGIKYYADRNTFIQAVAEYQFFFNSSDDIGDNYDDGAFVYSIGVGFNF